MFPDASLPKTAPMVAGQAALSEASAHTDVIHTSLAGMLLIVLVLLFAVALPVFGLQPVAHLLPFCVMVAAAVLGIGYLYYVNYIVHRHVSNQPRLTEVLVNSLGQGFLSFNRQGICGRVYSQACLDLLETVPANQRILDVLRLSDAERSDFNDWVDILFDAQHALSFEDVALLLPRFYNHSAGRRIVIAYRPIRDKDGALTNVVVIVTDETEQYEALAHAQQQQSYAQMICRIFKERGEFHATIVHTRKFIEMVRRPNAIEKAETLLRSLHTLKAAVRHFHLNELGETIHKLESALRQDEAADPSKFLSRLSLGARDIEDGLQAALDQVKSLIGEDYERRGNAQEIDVDVIYDFACELREKTQDQDLVELYLKKIAAVPVQECFSQFDHALIDLADSMGKQVKPIRYSGSNPKILPRMLHEFFFSLTHVCRNIVDHGIEPAVTRMARNKDPAGQVSIHTEILVDSQTQKETLHITISDDGNGIDPSRVREKLATTAPNGAWQHEDDATVIQNIFNWGFSTRDNVTDISGRGVGLEAVEREVKDLGGTIRVSSELYKGTCFDIRIPYIFDLSSYETELLTPARQVH